MIGNLGFQNVLNLEDTKVLSIIMEMFDTLKPEDSVTTTIVGPEGDHLYQSTVKGITKIQEAVDLAIANAALVVKPEDCVFIVKNDQTLVAHEYRLNAHGKLTQVI